MIRLRATLEIEYDPNGATPTDLKYQLRNNIEIMIGKGMLAGGSKASVEEWLLKLEEIEPFNDEVQNA